MLRLSKVQPFIISQRSILLNKVIVVTLLVVVILTLIKILSTALYFEGYLIALHVLTNLYIQ